HHARPVVPGPHRHAHPRLRGHRREPVALALVRGQLRCLREEQDRAPGAGRGTPPPYEPPQADSGLRPVGESAGSALERVLEDGRLPIPIQLRRGDLDAFNHVNSTSMLKLLEEARVRAFRRPAPGGRAPATATLDSNLASGLLTLIARQEI